MFSTTHDDRTTTTVALDLAREIGHRLTDQALVDGAVRACDDASRYPFAWGAPSLSSGSLGSAALLRELARRAERDSDPDEAGRWRTAAHEQLVTAVRSTHIDPLTDSSLMGGSAGVLLTILDALEDDDRYTGAADRLARDIARAVDDAPSWRRWIGLRDSDYDLVSGAAGTLVALSLAYERTEDPRVLASAHRLREDLEWCCGPVQPHGRRPWWISPDAYPAPDYLDEYPHGYVNLGLAHGVPGILVALATAVACGTGGATTLQCVRDVADHLLGVVVHDHGRSGWPMGVPLDRAGDEVHDDLHDTRAAWCYGTPGIASALQRAAEVLDDDHLANVARAAADGVVAAASTTGPAASATLCHGAAGLVVMACDVAGDPGRRPSHEVVDPLLRDLISHCDEDHLLVVRDLEPPDTLLDSPGLLTGAAGVGLALLAPAGSRAPLWRAAFGTRTLR